MKKLISLIYRTATYLLLVCCMIFLTVSLAEETTEIPNQSEVIVQVKLLLGRARPSRKAKIEARFDKGDVLIATGDWSPDHHWIEVYGGETGTVWVYADYVSERKAHIFVVNENYKKVKIRARPFDGKITGYLKKGKMIDVTNVVLGWGKTEKGWIEMFYVEEY